MLAATVHCSFAVFAMLVAVWAPPVLTGSSAFGDQSVSLTIGKFQIDQKLSKGRDYNLAGFGIVNPGDEAGAFRVTIAPMPGQSERVAPASWFKVETPSVTIPAKGTQQIPIVLSIPHSARPDTYRTLLRAEIAPPESEGTRVGAAVAAPVIFEVKSSTILEDLQVRAEDFAGENQPWTYVVPGALAAVAALWFFRKNFSISLAKKP